MEPDFNVFCTVFNLLPCFFSKFYVTIALKLWPEIIRMLFSFVCIVLYWQTVFWLMHFHFLSIPHCSVWNFSKTFQNRFAEAVNSAVMGVFGASLKLSSFYGLLTYVTHTIAEVRLVFLPAAVAAILGAVPVFGTYLACVPAFLELWLLHDQLLGAVLLLLAHLLPTYGGFDTAIYGQISGNLKFCCLFRLKVDQYFSIRRVPGD